MGALGRPLMYSKVFSSGAIRPARAPPSIDMLQIVMRPSIESSRIASPAYSMTWPVPPAVPISPMMARMMSLAVTPAGSLPSTRTSMFFALRSTGRRAQGGTCWCASMASCRQASPPRTSSCHHRRDRHGGGTGHVIEYAGEAIRDLSMEGPHDGVQHVDTRARTRRLDRAGREDIRIHQGPSEGAVGQGLRHGHGILGRASDEGAHIRQGQWCSTPPIAADRLWGSSPEDVVAVTLAPLLIRRSIRTRRARLQAARTQYMGLTLGTKMTDIKIDRVSIGRAPMAASRISRRAKVVKGAGVAGCGAATHRCSGLGVVKEQAEAEGLQTRSSVRQASTGANRAAPCALPMNGTGCPERFASTSAHFRGTPGLQGPHASVSPQMAVPSRQWLVVRRHRAWKIVPPMLRRRRAVPAFFFAFISGGCSSIPYVRIRVERGEEEQ